MVRYFGPIALALLVTPGVHAQTTEQRNAMNHIAQVAAIEANCTRLQGNHALMAVLMAELKIDIDKEPFKSYILKRGIEVSKDMQKYDENTVCVTGRMLYGRRGSNVKNLLLEN